MSKAGCILQAHHTWRKLLSDDEPLDLDTPQGRQRLKERSEKIEKACIVTIDISEAQARTIVERLWPGEMLLGATSGRGFAIETEDQTLLCRNLF
jgi:hypothetical protein